MPASWYLPPSLADLGQFPRLRRFRSAHPEWQVGYDHDHQLWRALRQEEAETVAVRYLLSDLLDRLDVLAAPDPGG